jgi:hypothetical protein
MISIAKNGTVMDFLVKVKLEYFLCDSNSPLVMEYTKYTQESTSMALN